MFWFILKSPEFDEISLELEITKLENLVSTLTQDGTAPGQRTRHSYDPNHYHYHRRRDTPRTGPAMAELRHATVAAAAARASSSPAKRDAESASSPFLPSPRGGGGDGGKDGALRSSPPLHQRCPLPAPVRALLALEDPRSPSAPASYRILLAVLVCLALAALVSAPSVWSRLVSPPPRRSRRFSAAFRRDP
jgi:hypothetical protein